LCDEYRRQSVDAWKLNESVELKFGLIAVLFRRLRKSFSPF
jgi:hypothetical protein